MITSPILTGGLAAAEFTAFMHSFSKSFGSGAEDLTGTSTGLIPPVCRTPSPSPQSRRTVVVSVRTGFVHSLIAYSYPLVQLWPDIS